MKQSRESDVAPAAEYELEVVPGLEPFARSEVEGRLRGSARLLSSRDGRIPLLHAGDAGRLNELRSVVAVHAVERFAVPRPRALLGQQALDHLVEVATWVIGLHPAGSFRTLRIAGAGADSPVFLRLRAVLAESLGLNAVAGPAHLLLTVRRPPEGGGGWQVLVRTSPRPLAARDWRVCDMPGALNATVASVMAGLGKPSADERYLNLACGSGTLLVERLRLGPARWLGGVDVRGEALVCATANLEAAGFTGRAELRHADARHLELPPASVDTVVADLPYGMLVGSGAENRELYPALVAEAARLAAPNAVCVLITTQHGHMRAALAGFGGGWQHERTIPLKIPHEAGYLIPSVYVLRREG